MHLKSVRKYFYKYRRKLLLGIFITIIARVFALIMPEYVQYSLEAIQNAEGKDLSGKLIRYVFIIIGSALLAGFFTFWMRQLIINMSRYIEYDIKNEVYQKYQTLSQHFYKQNRTGDLMNRISEDVGKVRMYAGPAIMYGVQTITLVLCIVPMMIITSPTLTLYSVMFLPLLAGLIFFISKKIHKKTLLVQQYLSELSAFTQETFSGMSVIKAYNLEEQSMQDTFRISKKGLDKNLDLARTQAYFTPVMSGLISLSVLLVLFIGGRLYIQGEISSIGVLAKFNIYVMMLTWPVASIGWISSTVQQAEASQKRINEFLEIPDELVSTANSTAPIEGEITFKNVSLTYPDTGIKALNGVSFSVKKGQTIAIVGKTGCGKSSMLDLICRVYDPTEGQILIDGNDIRSYNLTHLRSNIASVPQESFLFSDTIENNIRFGKPNATPEEIIQAATLSCVHHNIENFTNGYQSELSERGVSVSGGQRQRICIARALIKPAQIYLFDDCLSAVDAHTEEQILHNLTQMAPNKTKIIVSHRTSVSRDADLILMLNGGEIAEIGTHDELCKKQGLYAAYYLAQNTKNS